MTYFLLRCPLRESKPLECYALLIAKITSLSSTYENYNQSKVDEAFEKWNCSRETTDRQCPPGGPHPPSFLCKRCKDLESSAGDWNGPNITEEEYGALLIRNAAR